jgi:hypothetical protein
MEGERSFPATWDDTLYPQISQRGSVVLFFDEVLRVGLPSRKYHIR